VIGRGLAYRPRVYLTVVNDPDGNFIELVGPKK
jgi:hypothetical protein